MNSIGPFSATRAARFRQREDRTCGRGMKKAGTRGPGPVYRGGRIVLCCFSSVGTYPRLRIFRVREIVCSRPSVRCRLLRSVDSCLGPLSLVAFRSSGSLLFTRGASPDGLQPVRSDHAVLSSVGRGCGGCRGGRVSDAQLLLHLGSNVDEVGLVECHEGAVEVSKTARKPPACDTLSMAFLAFSMIGAISSLYFFS